MPLLTIGGRFQVKGSITASKKRALVRSTMFKKAADDFRLLLDQIAAWATDNADRVAKLFLIVDVEMIDLYVVGKGDEYDFVLRSVLSELVLAFRETGTPVRGSIIPDGTVEELQGIFDHGQAMSLLVGGVG